MSLLNVVCEKVSKPRFRYITSSWNFNCFVTTISIYSKGAKLYKSYDDGKIERGIKLGEPNIQYLLEFDCDVDDVSMVIQNCYDEVDISFNKELKPRRAESYEHQIYMKFDRIPRGTMMTIFFGEVFKNGIVVKFNRDGSITQEYRDIIPEQEYMVNFNKIKRVPFWSRLLNCK